MQTNAHSFFIYFYFVLVLLSVVLPASGRNVLRCSRWPLEFNKKLSPLGRLKSNAVRVDAVDVAADAAEAADAG